MDADTFAYCYVLHVCFGITIKTGESFCSGVFYAVCHSAIRVDGHSAVAAMLSAAEFEFVPESCDDLEIPHVYEVWKIFSCFM